VGESDTELAGLVTRELAGEDTGELAGEMNGEVAGEATAGEGRGPDGAGAVVVVAGGEGTTDVLLNGGRCAVIATTR
jgi:hypothetical protein